MRLRRFIAFSSGPCFDAKWLTAAPGLRRLPDPAKAIDGEDGVLLGCFFQQTFLTGAIEFLGYHLETDQLGGTEGR